MKHSDLTSAFLLVILIGLGVGWWIDHDYQKQLALETASGTAHYERINSTVANIFNCNHCGDELKLRNQKRKLCKCILDAWRFRTEIDSVSRKEQMAVKLSNEALWLLGLKESLDSTQDDALQILLEMNPVSRGNYFPELHQEGSSEQESLLQFLSSSLAYKAEWEKTRSN